MLVNSTVPKTEALLLQVPAGEDAKEPPGRKAATPAQQPKVGESHPADRAFHAALARFSGGISPVALLLAYTDWLSHMAMSPPTPA
jgi:polyhydroxyalkanoate synthase